MAAFGGRPLTVPTLVRADRRRVALVCREKTPAVEELCRRLADALRARGAEVTVLPAREDETVAQALAGCDWAVTLGGDGTFVRAARLAAPAGVPILGVNFGQLGFLSELEPEEAVLRVPELLRSERWLESHLMLRCSATRGADRGGPWDAVNDVFVGRGRVARAVRLSVAIDGVPLARLSADGLLVATPTGSTAYSLSAGGPVIVPQMEALLLTPVMPHPEPMRALVVPASSRFVIRVDTDEEATLAIDGQIHQPLASGDTVEVTKGPHTLKVLRFRPAEGFYGVLVERLHRWRA